MSKDNQYIDIERCDFCHGPYPNRVAPNKHDYRLPITDYVRKCDYCEVLDKHSAYDPTEPDYNRDEFCE